MEQIRKGRPPLEDYQKVRNQRIAVDFDTYKRIKYHSKKKDIQIKEYLELIVPKTGK